MTARFQNLPFKVATLDGRTFVLLADVYFLSADGTRYLLPLGATSDGASTPREGWPLLPPFGRYWPAAYLHDCAYRNTLCVLNNRVQSWLPASLPREKCDALFKEAMQSLGVNNLEMETIYEAVALAGESSFAADRSAGPEKFMA